MKIEELKEIVEKATPGPWILGYDLYDEEGPLHAPEYSGEVVDAKFGSLIGDMITTSNAEFLEAFNPEFIKKLLALWEAEINYRACKSQMVGFQLHKKIDVALMDLEKS